MGCRAVGSTFEVPLGILFPGLTPWTRFGDCFRFVTGAFFELSVGEVLRDWSAGGVFAASSTAGSSRAESH